MGDLMKLLKYSNRSAWYKNLPKLPVLLVAGADDPVGNYGKGPAKVYSELMLAGCSRVTLKLYEGARHELFNEYSREEFFGDIVGWLDGAV
jgi:alpha-beta hydrolase superfamily lysophospholipase